MPAVVGRTGRGRLLLDLRAVPPAEDERLAAAVLAAAAERAPQPAAPVATAPAAADGGSLPGRE
jgi:hypothetical protein